MTPLLAILAQHSQEAPSGGVGAGLIVGTIAGVTLLMVLIWVVFTRTTRATRGGVQRRPKRRDALRR